MHGKITPKRRIIMIKRVELMMNMEVGKHRIHTQKVERSAWNPVIHSLLLLMTATQTAVALKREIVRLSFDN